MADARSEPGLRKLRVRLISAAFQMLPGAAFTVSGARPAADSALVGGRAEMKWRNGLSLAGTVEGEFSRSTQTYTGKGTVRFMSGRQAPRAPRAGPIRR
ncbi:hypothetical protein [Bradyrhizobium sp. LA6.12]|uniref:hypothetical protein n=1 Tax=unclassified Bradyrhizobium TaxID=2631580 RepID=UPI003399C521